MVRVLIVGQTPPPYLGGPIMLEFLVRSQMQDIELCHLRIELSTDKGQVGKFRWAKLFRLFLFIVRIIYTRIVLRPQILYYPPEVVPRLTMLRDAVILCSTRFLFPKTVFHFHSSGYGNRYEQLPRWQRWLFRRGLFHADGAIRLTELTPDDAKGLQAKREYIVPNGINDLGANLSRPLAGHLVAAGNPLRVLFIALLSESKGLLVLIDACARLVACGVPIRLEVMGPFENPEFEARTRARIAQLKLEECVHFLGPLSGADKLSAFARTDVLCHPTFNDSFGIVLLEAMSCSLPVVATRWCSIPSIVDDGKTGFLVEPHDANEVADRLACLAQNPELREQMGAAGRKKFLREFTVARHVERMRDVFLDVAGVSHAAENPHVAEALVST
jgi:glycosyltransferase involved in cell wall biosynthesis